MIAENVPSHLDENSLRICDQTLSCRRTWVNRDCSQIYLTISQLIMSLFFNNALIVLQLPALADMDDPREMEQEEKLTCDEK